MRPTFSIIAFTVLSGAGYGLWLLASLCLWIAPAGMDLDTRILVDLGIGLVLVGVGLLSSLGHLGQPQRAWRALSQWRSSWLSREGVAALLTFLPAIALMALLWTEGGHAAICIASALLAAGAVITVYCTAHIYASLKTIRAWNNKWAVAGYLLLALGSGSVWLWAIHGHLPRAAMLALALLALAMGLFKLGYWRHVDQLHRAPPLDATGLGRFGQVSRAEAPHTEENYLCHELGFQLARKHSARLRPFAAINLGLLPGLLAILAVLVPGASAPLAWLALACCLLGLVVERWLFFAEARHVVMLFYGAREA